MEIISEKYETVFRKDYNGKPSYSLGLSKKDKDGKYINGYIRANFRKGTDIKNKTKIKIKEAWLDFFKEDEKTIPTIFVNDYDIAREGVGEHKEENPFKEFGDHITTKFEAGKQISITDDDLPF